MTKKILLLLLLLCVPVVFATNQWIGFPSDITYNGSVLSSGNFTVVIFDASTGGNNVYNETFANAITNGRAQAILGLQNKTLDLIGGNRYYAQLWINENNRMNFTVNGTDTDRMPFTATYDGDHLANFSNVSINNYLNVGNAFNVSTKTSIIQTNLSTTINNALNIFNFFNVTPLISEARTNGTMTILSSDIDSALNLSNGGAFIGNFLNIANFLNFTPATSTIRTNGTLTILSLLSPAFTVQNGFNVSGADESLRTNGTITIINSASDALNVSGGAIINGSLNVNGTAIVNGTPIILSQDAVSNIQGIDIKQGSKALTANNESTLFNWTPASGETWKINRMIIQAPLQRVSPPNDTMIKIIMSNGTDEFLIYRFNNTINSNIMSLIFGEDFAYNINPISSANLSLFNTTTILNTSNIKIKDTLYISNSMYLKVNITNSDTAQQTASWWVQGTKIKSSSSSPINTIDIKQGSKALTADSETTIFNWTPASGQTWKINRMIIQAPPQRNTPPNDTMIKIIMSNGTDEFLLYKFNNTFTPNIMNLIYGEDFVYNATPINSANLTFLTSETNTTVNIIVKDTLYISNSMYLKVNITNGDPAQQTARWWVQGIRVT